MTKHPFDIFSDASAWMSSDPDPETRDELLQTLEKATAGDIEAIAMLEERFTSRLEFGTAGIRGPMGFGPHAMNRLVVAHTTAGLARFLLARSCSDPKQLRVVVGHDSRKNSAIFAKDTAEVLSGHGIEVLLTPSYVPTPIVAFAVRSLDSDAGIMVTASHNPAEDNGYKVYFGGQDDGSQIVPPVDTDIEAHIQKVADNETSSTIQRSTELISVLKGDIVEKYLLTTLNSLLLTAPAAEAPIVVYTAMHGVGGETFLAAMDKAGFPEPYVVDQQFYPDPDFPTVAFPNPEEKGALDLSFDNARTVSADLIIAHDPDADRLAVALPDSTASGGYTALTGNQVGAIFGWHIAQKARSSEKTGTLANSIVSSPVLGKIANHFGLDHEETLTGFKYVSRAKNLIFGFEEALGYLVTPDVVRDKDGISAGLLMVSLAHTLATEGKTLWDYLHEIEESVGAFASGQVTIRLSAGVAGSTVTTALRERELSALGSRSVTRVDDFLEGVGDFPKEDILRYYLDDGTRVIARPSGTEPKVKVYIDTEGATSAEAQSRLTEVESNINKLVSSL
jgi:phosphomannomutase